MVSGHEPETLAEALALQSPDAGIAIASLTHARLTVRPLGTRATGDGAESADVSGQG